MITVSNIGNPSLLPNKPAGVRRVASIDLEWTKNYRIKNGNRPFCYSVVYLDLPDQDALVDLEDVDFAFTSVYVEDPDEMQELIKSAAEAVGQATEQSDILVGHQFCADLGVLANASDTPNAAIDDARATWKRRRTPDPGDPVFVDTRYDAGHLLNGASRRLVDVCEELKLDVTQPELRSTSMTALHRKWLDRDDVEARERISTLNVRHSLSTAYVAVHSAGLGRWDPVHGLNVNRKLAAGADGAWQWLQSSTFTNLLEDSCPSGTAPSSPSKASRQAGRPRSSTR
ncbi:hypothetical protein [Streptomyces sp. H27-C3]|uniref:hypothetical protein n=1 Tax=Streptomyces sp. H27-C3 TaxID=3046305 RepID=UPI0024BB6AAD|nr:hypothetical protein [Streptomyces sp. H27-C3]MDJ0463128.1 hypothetical protein [Streptomyces sp. H27-C3]